MNRPHQPRPPAPDAVLSLTVASSTPHEEWCTACKAYTRLAGELLLLTPDGVACVGLWTWCDICEDLTDQDDRRNARG